MYLYVIYAYLMSAYLMHVYWMYVYVEYACLMYIYKDSPLIYIYRMQQTNSTLNLSHCCYLCVCIFALKFSSLVGI